MLAAAFDRIAEEPLYLRTFNRVRENAAAVLRAFPAVLAILAVSAVAGCGGSELLTTNEQIYVVPAVGGHARRLTNRSPASLGPAWSPDGTRLAFVSGRNLLVATHDKPLTTMPLPGFPTSDPPSWAPNGRRLTVSTISRDEKTTSIVVARADGRSVGIVAQTGAGTADSDRGPAWSPDGKLLAYALQGPDIEGQGGVRASGELDLAVVSPDGSGRRRLTTAPGYESDPRWSPDGRWILYASEADSGESAAIDVVAPDGTGRGTVVSLPGAEISNLAWSPDGTTIAFAAEKQPPES